MNQIKVLLDGLRSVLSGEPARVIGYGGAVVIYIVAKASGAIPDQTIDQSLAEAGAALVVVGTFVETIRHYVYAPDTVAGLLSEQADSEHQDVTPEVATF